MIRTIEAAMPQLGYHDLMDFAKRAIGKRDLPVARQRFEEALQVKSDSVEARYGLATVCFMQKDIDAAWQNFEDVRNIDPQHAGACINLGAICNYQGKCDDAINYLRKAIQIDRTRCEAYYNLGIAYKKLGKFELAIQAYREAHHLNPRMVEAVYNLANLYQEMDRLDQAAAHYKLALEINPGFRKARDASDALMLKMKAQQAALSNTDEMFDSEDTSSDDAMVSDARLDRVLDPEIDYDVLTRLHNDSKDLERIALAWHKVTSDLDGAVRNVAIHLSGKGNRNDMEDAYYVLRDALKNFQNARQKFEQEFDELSAHRDQLLGHD